MFGTGNSICFRTKDVVQLKHYVKHVSFAVKGIRCYQFGE